MQPSSKYLLLGAFCALVPSHAGADEIYLCEGAVSAIVVETGTHGAGRDEPCVKDWKTARAREERKRLAAVSDPYGPARGVSTRDFCYRDEPCHKSMPRWTPRWDYAPARRKNSISVVYFSAQHGRW